MPYTYFTPANNKIILNYLDKTCNIYRQDDIIRNVFVIICEHLRSFENKESNVFFGSNRCDIRGKLMVAIQEKTISLTDNTPFSSMLHTLSGNIPIDIFKSALVEIESHVFSVYNSLRKIIENILQDDSFELKYGKDNYFFAVCFTNEYLNSLHMENYNDKLHYLNTKIGNKLSEMYNNNEIIGFRFTQVQNNSIKIYDSQ
jgi:hypothetical protein